MAWIPSMSQQMFEVASMGPCPHILTDKQLQMLCDVGDADCQVTWLGKVHTCCLLTISMCLAIHKHHLCLFLEWVPDHCASTLLNTHCLRHAQPTLQVMRDCHQCHLPWKLCISGHKVIWTFMLHFQSEITPWSLSVNLKLTLYNINVYQMLVYFHFLYLTLIVPSADSVLLLEITMANRLIHYNFKNSIVYLFL